MDEILKVLVDEVVYPIWIKDMEFKNIYVNKEYANLHNKSKNELIGVDNTVIYKDDKNVYNMFQEFLIEVKNTGKPVIKTHYTYFGYKECYIMPIKNEKGKLIAIAGIINSITDIGKLKEQEYEIGVQKNLINKIMDILPGVIFYKDKCGKYIYANKNCQNFYLERGVDNIIGKTDLEINSDKKLVMKFLDDDKLIMENKVEVHNEVVLKDVNGNSNYREVVKIPLMDNYGNVKGIVGRSLDITERKKYEKKLEYLSYTDILTGVGNRASFIDTEEQLSKEENVPLGVIMGDVNGLKLVNDTFGHIQGDRLLVEISKVLIKACPSNSMVFRIGGDEFVILIKNSSLAQCEEVIVNIINGCEGFKDDLFHMSISLGYSLKKNKSDNIDKVLKEAEDKLYRQKLLKKESVKGSILSSLKIGLGVRSVETEEHGERVEKNALRLGKKLGLELSLLDDLKIVAGLHDIGKIGIGEHILLKPGPLSNEEYEIMKTHSEKGYRIVMATGELRGIAESILYHHERYDGMGYPRGLKGEEIPLLARIISVCDAYDVMISDRIYKKAISKEEAIEELKRCSGSQFDSKVVEAFLEII